MNRSPSFATVLMALAAMTMLDMARSPSVARPGHHVVELPADSAGACWQPAESSGGLLERLRVLVAASDSETVAMRDSLQLPAITATAVQVVSDDTVCIRAVAASYDASSATVRDTSAAPSRRGRRLHSVCCL